MQLQCLKIGVHATKLSAALLSTTIVHGHAAVMSSLLSICVMSTIYLQASGAWTPVPKKLPCQLVLDSKRRAGAARSIFIQRGFLQPYSRPQMSTLHVGVMSSPCSNVLISAQLSDSIRSLGVFGQVVALSVFSTTNCQPSNSRWDSIQLKLDSIRLSAAIQPTVKVHLQSLGMRFAISTSTVFANYPATSGSLAPGSRDSTSGWFWALDVALTVGTTKELSSSP